MSTHILSRGGPPKSSDGWEAEWDELLEEQNEARRYFAGDPEMLKTVDEHNDFMRGMYRVCWHLWLMSQKLGTPKWRKKKHRRLDAAIARHEARTLVFVEGLVP